METTQINEKPTPNGLHCPECGAELLDKHPNVTLTSHPAQKEVVCSECDYTGYRFVMK